MGQWRNDLIDQTHLQATLRGKKFFAIPRAFQTLFIDMASFRNEVQIRLIRLPKANCSKLQILLVSTHSTRGPVHHGRRVGAHQDAIRARRDEHGTGPTRVIDDRNFSRAMAHERIGDAPRCQVITAGRIDPHEDRKRVFVTNQHILQSITTHSGVSGTPDRAVYPQREPITVALGAPYVGTLSQRPCREGKPPPCFIQRQMFIHERPYCAGQIIGVHVEVSDQQVLHEGLHIAVGELQ